jgi:molybdate transport system substrate-binding protein
MPGLGDFLATSNGSLSLANPKLAPYGAAALDIIDAQGIESLSAKLVYGENVAGAYALVATGSAQAGLVALSQLLDQGVPERYFRVIPSSSHRAIDQAAVLTRRGTINSAATAFLVFLNSQSSRTFIEQAGYTVPSPRMD